MKLQAQKVKWSEDSEGVWLSVLSDRSEKYHVQEWCRTFQPAPLNIEKARQKRSLNANAYLWVLLEKIAQAIHSDKDSVYLQELEKYGVFSYVIVHPSAVDKMLEQWRTATVLGEVEVNGKTGVQILCYYGSSTYNTAEMARLIDGVVSDAKELGIETETPETLERMKSEWGIGKQS